jgi:hypothetical protein
MRSSPLLFALVSTAIVGAALAGPAHADDPAPAPTSTTATTATDPAAAPLPTGKVARVGIVIGLAINVDSKITDQIGGALATTLVAQLEVDAIGGAEVTRRLPATGLPDDCVSSPDCINDLASRLSADQLMFLSVVKVRDGYQVDATFIDVATGAVAARPRVQLADPDQAAATFKIQAVRYLPDAKVRDTGTSTVIVKGNEAHRPIRPVVWAFGAGGLAAVATGVIVGLSAKSKYDSCDSGDRFCTDSEKDSIENRALIADIAMGVGVGCLVAATVFYFTTPLERPPELSPSVTPVAGGAVISFDGRF